MRMASRDVCDAETWANTVLNRSSTSVQQRLDMLSQDSSWNNPNSSSSQRRLEFAPTDSVRLYVPDRREHFPLLWDEDFMEAEESEESDDSEDEHDEHDGNHASSYSIGIDELACAPRHANRFHSGALWFGEEDTPIAQDVEDRLTYEGAFNIW